MRYVDFAEMNRVMEFVWASGETRVDGVRFWLAEFGWQGGTIHQICEEIIERGIPITSPLTLATAPTPIAVAVPASFDGDYWAIVCETILADNRDGVNHAEKRKALRAEKLWRRDTFRAFYRLKHNAKRKTVQRVIRKELSAGLWCRHTASDNNFNSGFVPKMAGFSERTALGDIVNIDAELPSTMVIPILEQYDSLRIGTENRPTRTEHRKAFTRTIWRNGQKDTIEDSTSYVEWRERLVNVAAFSSRCTFDFTYKPEAEDVFGPKDAPIQRSAFREDCNRRWIEPRLDFEGNLLPQNSLAKCDDGRDIPDLNLANWQLGADGYVLDSVPRYVTKSILSAFRLNIAAGNAQNNGGLRPCYNGKQRADIRHEFVQECLQTVALAHLECLRCVRKFTGILNSALSRIITDFVRKYCAGGSARDRKATIERTKRNANALAQKLAQFSGLQFQSDADEQIVKGIMAGHTQTELAESLKVSQQTVSKRIKETIALNRVLAQLELETVE